MKRAYIYSRLLLMSCAAFPIAAEAETVPSVSAQSGTEVLPVKPSIVATFIDEKHITGTVVKEGTLADSALKEQRGGTAIVVGNQTLNAVNSGGIINGNFSAGSINLADNALTNFNGFGNLVINTGAQNNLQSGMNVTINFTN